MIIAPKQPRNDKTASRLSRLVPYMLRGKGQERCTWYMAGNLEGLDRRQDAELAVEVMQLLQESNTRAKGDKTYHLVISFHPEDRRLTPHELKDVVARTVRTAGLEEHQFIAVRHSEQEHEHVHIAVNKIHPRTLRIHHPFRDIPAYQALANVLERELGLQQVERSRNRSQSHRARSFEAHQGVENFARWARRTIGQATELDRIGSWSDLHHELARFGVRLVPRGNGLALVDATRERLRCKASALGRAWSKQRLQQRFGAFERGRATEHVAEAQRERYEPVPLGRARDNGLWHEYQHELAAARAGRAAQREAFSSKVRTAREQHRRHFRARHHAIAAMPIPPRDKRRLYKMLAVERKADLHGLGARMEPPRGANAHGHPGSWKQFLAERAARGDERAVQRLSKERRAASIQLRSSGPHVLSQAGSLTSRGTRMHRVGPHARIRESAGLLELVGEPSPEALTRLVALAQQRFRGTRVRAFGSRALRKEVETLASAQGLRIAEREHER